MSYLAFDTSTQTLAVALGNETIIQAEYISTMRKDHSSRLMPAIDRIMKEADVKPGDLKGIIVAKGPGSYTGLRIGVSTAKSMAWALKIPLLGISSLFLVARSCKYFPGYIVPMIDARRGQVYTGLYRFQGNRDVMEQDRLILMQDWLQFLKEKYCDSSSSDVAQLMFVGNDWPLHHELIASIIPERHLQFAGISNHSSRAAELLEIGIPMLQRGETHDARNFAPEYLRLAEAEQNWLNQQNLKA